MECIYINFCSLQLQHTLSIFISECSCGILLFPNNFMTYYFQQVHVYKYMCSKGSCWLLANVSWAIWIFWLINDNYQYCHSVDI